MASNIAICLSHSNKASATSIELAEEKSISILERLAELMYRSSVANVSNILFKELNAAKVFELLIGKVFKELMKIGDDFISQMEAK